MKHLRNTMQPNTLTEILGAGFIVFMMVVVGYFGCLHNAIQHIAAFAKTNHDLTLQYHQLQTQCNQDKTITARLASWEKNYPDEYHLIQQSMTENELLPIATQSIRSANFTLIQANPMLSKNNLVELVMTGSFKALFHFIELLNTSPYPITISSVQLTQKNNLEIRLIAQGEDD